MVLLSIAVIGFFLLFDEDVQHIDEMLSAMSPWWLVGALGCVAVYCLGETVMYQLACRYMQCNERFSDSVINTMLGLFYNALTPLASGGQPFQVIQMHERGISVGTATSVMMVKFLAWHIALSTVGLTGFFLFGDAKLAIGGGMKVLFCVGYLVHLCCAAAGILLMFKPDFVHRIGRGLIGFVSRVFFERNAGLAERVAAGWEHFVGEYGAAMAYVRAHRRGMIWILAVALVEVTGYLSVTYFIYRGLGFCEFGYPALLALQAMLSMSVAFIPLPGASGASEGGFYLLFSGVFGDARLAGMLLWRTLTYYLIILLGLGTVLVDGFRTRRKRGDSDVSV